MDSGFFCAAATGTGTATGSRDKKQEQDAYAEASSPNGSVNRKRARMSAVLIAFFLVDLISLSEESWSWLLALIVSPLLSAVAIGVVGLSS